MSAGSAAASRRTAKGERARARIVDTAADLLHDRGAASTTLADVRVAAGVSSSQLYHYFADKRALVHAVVDRRSETVVANQQGHGLHDLASFRAWRDAVVEDERARQGRGGCPLGSLGAELAEHDPEGRSLVARGFERWASAIEQGLRRMQQEGGLPGGLDTARLATGILAALQGGLLLAQLQRDAAPLAAALDVQLDLLARLAAEGAR